MLEEVFDDAQGIYPDTKDSLSIAMFQGT